MSSVSVGNKDELGMGLLSLLVERGIPEGESEQLTIRKPDVDILYLL